jgi:hypothetical protein
MKSMRTKAVVTIVIFVSIVFFGSVARGGPENPSGAPPFGVAVSSDAPGTKLTGVAFFEFYNLRNVGGGQVPQVLADVRAFVRLRQGTVVKPVFAQIANVDLNNLPQTQASIVAGLKNEILIEFFEGDLSLDVKLKGFDEFVQSGEFTILTPAGSKLTLADIVFSVK